MIFGNKFYFQNKFVIRLIFIVFFQKNPILDFFQIFQKLEIGQRGFFFEKSSQQGSLVKLVPVLNWCLLFRNEKSYFKPLDGLQSALSRHRQDLGHGVLEPHG